MRKWHRWLSLFFGVFMLWMAGPACSARLCPLCRARDKPPVAGAAPASISKLQPDFVCPADVQCRPKQRVARASGLLHHLHSGETFGPVGVLISTLTGFALLFFSMSGLWLMSRCGATAAAGASRRAGSGNDRLIGWMTKAGSPWPCQGVMASHALPCPFVHALKLCKKLLPAMRPPHLNMICTFVSRDAWPQSLWLPLRLIYLLMGPRGAIPVRVPGKARKRRDRSQTDALLEASKTYKPFEYPWAYDFWKRQQQVHWLPEEVPLGEDCRDWGADFEHERNLLTQIFRFFTQADVEVQDCYHEKYGRVFKPTEIKMMLAAFEHGNDPYRRLRTCSTRSACPKPNMACSSNMRR
jgi:hypothetical protein